MAKNLMVQGTMSNAGKSIVTAGILRVLKQDGYRVAPFKSQNMALNSYITKDGLEMGRAQVMQAEAAGIEPCVQMNPILLKPTSDVGSQVIVNGVPLKNMPAKEYFKYKKKLIPDILSAYETLDRQYDVIVLEGAGSPAEINLKQDDIVNMGMAALVDAPVLLVGDIDRGGVFAQLAGTLMLLEEEERRRVKGLVMNKFRGDKKILEPGLDQLYDICHVPTIGVIPYTRLDIEEEDSLAESLLQTALPDETDMRLDIAVIRLPHISNFTDLDALARLDGVRVRYADRAEQIQTPDLLILPGTKNTIDDLKWLRRTGLESPILNCARKGIPVLGICGGYQMLGNEIDDSCGAETGEVVPGLGLLPVKTVFSLEKHRTRVKGRICAQSGIWGSVSGCECTGYEIHMGESRICEENAQGFIQLTNQSDLSTRADGCVCENVAGTYLHGIFDEVGFCGRLIETLCRQKGMNSAVSGQMSFWEYKQREYDKLADVIRENMDMEYLYRVMGLALNKIRKLIFIMQFPDFLSNTSLTDYSNTSRSAILNLPFAVTL